MKYASIRKMDIANGPGVRVSIFVSGCVFHCQGCFNKEAWDFDYGKDFTDETIKFILELCDKPEIVGISLLGGEPLHPLNRVELTRLLVKFREKFGDTKSVWCWTGNEFKDINEISKITMLKYVDVVIDGRFKEDLADWHLLYRGSSNQRVIDIKKSIEIGEITEISEKLVNN